MTDEELAPIDWKTARVRGGLTQHDIAQFLGVSQATISRFEKGIEELDKDLKIKLLTFILKRQRKV